MPNKTIAIIGFGWLGKPLAYHLMKEDYLVFIATGSQEKLALLEREGSNGFMIQYKEKIAHINLNDAQLKSIYCIVICLPPTGFANYAEIIKSIALQFSKTTRFIFTSSTGVYNETIGFVNEDSDKNLQHPVYLAEQKLLKLAAKRVTILRLAGLIGGKRHPVNYFVQKNLIPNSNAPINLVRQEDVIRAIALIIHKQVFGEIFNIVNPSHPSKLEYYREAAARLFSEFPIATIGNGGKIVSGTKFEKEMGFKYLFEIDEWDHFKGIISKVGKQE